MTNSFWNKKSRVLTADRNIETFLLDPRVTTREYGEIPGILKACDIHLRIPLPVMQSHTNERTEGFCRILKYWMNGRDAQNREYGHREFINDRFHRGDVKLSVIGNPSTPYQKEL